MIPFFVGKFQIPHKFYSSHSYVLVRLRIQI